MRINHAYFALGISLALAMGTMAYAQSGGGEVLLTMDEVAFQPINGLTVKGVTFADTAGANYNAVNGGQLVWVDDPTIVGPTVGETITMSFPYAVSDFQFGFALSTSNPVPNGVSVTLYSDTAGTQLIGTFTANATPLGITGQPDFAEGLFVSPSNVGVIGQAVVTFPGAAAVAPAFGLDNLTFSLYNNLFGDLLTF